MKCKWKAGKLRGEKSRSNPKSEKQESLLKMFFKKHSSQKIFEQSAKALWQGEQGMRVAPVIALKEHQSRGLVWKLGLKGKDSRKDCQCLLLGIYTRDSTRTIWDLHPGALVVLVIFRLCWGDRREVGKAKCLQEQARSACHGVEMGEVRKVIVRLRGLRKILGI